MKKIVQAAGAVLRVLTWTPSRYSKWKECPAKVKYEDLIKLCPKCFKGRVSGGYDGEPVVCDTCDEEQPERGPLDRGNRMDAALTQAVQTKKIPTKVVYALNVPEEKQVLASTLRHPAIHQMAYKLTKAKPKVAQVLTQESIVLDSKWQRVSQYTKNAWARLKLDVLVLAGKHARVIDWKSGNVDKTKGEIREKPEYHDSMRAYQMVVLAVYPEVHFASAEMVFLDAPPKLKDPTKSLPVLKRVDLHDAQQEWMRKIEPMMEDRIFSPRPGYYCTWCPFSKDKGGPCPHSGQKR